jgi:replicative DNA helicase
LIKGDDARAPRNEQINDIVESMKQLAGDIGCPVMLLSQLNRSADSEKPKVSHLALSGSIEQAADVIILLHNPPTSKDGIADVMIEKQRNGATGTIQMRFNKEATRFEEL